MLTAGEPALLVTFARGGWVWFCTIATTGDLVMVDLDVCTYVCMRVCICTMYARRKQRRLAGGLAQIERLRIGGNR